MERVGFTMRILPGQEADYRRRHAAVWPEMLDALKSAGCRDYSIFIRSSDLFAYLEVEDFAAFRAAMAASPVNARWQAEMAALIDPLPIRRRASTSASTRSSTSIERTHGSTPSRLRCDSGGDSSTVPGLDCSGMNR